MTLVDRQVATTLEEIARKAVAGDQGAKEALVDRLMPQIRTTIHYLAPGDRDADDLVQLAFIEILRSVHSFRGECRLETWASRVAVRTAMYQLKQRRRRRGLAVTENVEDAVEERSPEKVSEALQLRRHIKVVLQRLPVEQRTAVVLRCVQEMSLEEIAEATGSLLNTARERLRVGRKKFRRYLLQDPVLRDWLKRRKR